jgi:hypothetical protein
VRSPDFKTADGHPLPFKDKGPEGAVNCNLFQKKCEVPLKKWLFRVYHYLSNCCARIEKNARDILTNSNYKKLNGIYEGVFKKKYDPCLSDIFTNCKRKIGFFIPCHDNPQ